MNSIVKLQSSDKRVFTVPAQVISCSETITSRLKNWSDTTQGAEEPLVVLDNVSGDILQRVVVCLILEAHIINNFMASDNQIWMNALILYFRNMNRNHLSFCDPDMDHRIKLVDICLFTIFLSMLFTVLCLWLTFLALPRLPILFASMLLPNAPILFHFALNIFHFPIAFNAGLNFTFLITFNILMGYHFVFFIINELRLGRNPHKYKTAPTIREPKSLQREYRQAQILHLLHNNLVEKLLFTTQAFVTMLFSLAGFMILKRHDQMSLAPFLVMTSFFILAPCVWGTLLYLGGCLYSGGTMITNPDYVSVIFAGEASDSGFIAFAFSHDRFIGNNDVVIYCINALHQNNRAIALYQALAENHYAITQTKKSYFQHNFCPRFGHPQTEMMGCSFDLASKIYQDYGSYTDILNTPFYLMLSFGHFGDSVPITHPHYGSLESQHLMQFSSDPVVLKDALRNPKIIYPRSRALILWHGITAVIVFIFLIPTGMFCAKYGREAQAYDTELFGRYTIPAWLHNHLFLALPTVPLTIISLITIMFELDFAWRSFATGPMIHSYLPRAQAPCFVEYFGYLHLTICFCSHVIMSLDTKRLAIAIDNNMYFCRRVILGPMIPWGKQDIYVSKYEQFYKLDLWKARRRVMLFMFIISLISAFTISVLLLLPVVLCK